MANTGVTICTSGSFIASTGRDWTNSSNITVNDGLYASSTTSGSVTTDVLLGRGFGFTLSPTATIDGYEVSVEAHATGISGIITTVSVGVTGTLGTKSPSTFLTGSDVTYTYGGSTDTWGIGLTSSSINSSDFRVQVTATIALAAVFVDAVSVNVYYTDEGTNDVFCVGAGAQHIQIQHKIVGY